MNKNDQKCINCRLPIPVNGSKYTIQENGKTYVYCGDCEKGYQSHLEEFENPDSLIGTVKARVREDGFPVRYNHRKYYPGEELNVKPEHFSEEWGLANE